MDKTREKTLLIIAVVLASVCSKSVAETTNHNADAKIITIASLLDEMISFDYAANFPSPFYNCKMVSSRDRRSVVPNEDWWFANDDGTGYERLDTINGRIERVMFESDGPGAVTRIWMTAHTKKGGILRFYFDGEENPRFQIDAYDMTQAPFKVGDALSLIHTNYSTDPNSKGGNTFMLPLPYRKSCRITFEDTNRGANVWRYYEINYRTYEKGTKVETFTVNQVNSLQEKLTKVNESLFNPPTFKEGDKSERSGLIESNKSLVLRLLDGTQALKTLEIDAKCNKGDFAKMMRSLVLKITFDGKETVWVPLSDFSGGGLGAPKVDSWYLTSNGRGHIVSRWVMPYQKNAVIEIENLFEFPVHVSVNACTTDWQWTSNSLYFYTSWKQERGIPVERQAESADDRKNSEWNFITLSGRGIYRGDLLSLYNFAPDWYGEGDEKMWIDDDTFPSHYGTGTEDHYNCSWAPIVPFYTPFGGAPRADNPSTYGFNAFLRTRNLDDIPFNKSYRFDFEMMSWNPGKVDYATTCYWYGDINSEVKQTSGKEEILNPLPYLF